jgi:hypothetical protein
MGSVKVRTVHTVNMTGYDLCACPLGARAIYCAHSLVRHYLHLAQYATFVRVAAVPSTSIVHRLIKVRHCETRPTVARLFDQSCERVHPIHSHTQQQCSWIHD